MKEYGGYFELEFRKNKHYHENALKLNTARNSFEYILLLRKYKKVYIPYYTCEVIIDTLKKCCVNWEFYSISKELEPQLTYRLRRNEAFLYTNYFDLKQDCSIRLAKIYGKQLIVDNSQAFFAEPITGVDTFYSARKFFGVPDGAYLYTNNDYLDVDLEEDISFERISHLVKRLEINAKAGYSDYKNTENALSDLPIRKMSKLTSSILSSLDYQYIKEKRRFNYKMYDFILSKSNKLVLKLDSNNVPMVYPYLPEEKNYLKNLLINNNIYVPTFWNEVLKYVNTECLEYELVNMLTPLPVDQRYEKENIKEILIYIES